MLVAVSKTFSVQDIEPLIEAGQRHFGENRVQEAEKKYPPLLEKYPDLQLHMVGPLQSNKVRQALGLFSHIHSLDRLSLAEKLASEMGKMSKAPRLFIQVNIGGEAQKSGVAIGELAQFIEACRGQYGLSPEGLMCIPPQNVPPSAFFALLRKLSRHHKLPLLSMGMSNDFEAAILQGATHIRLGRALFGERPATPPQ